MIAIFITYNQALHDEILEVMSHRGVKGYTGWDSVVGRGSENGEPHLGSHAWPTMNSAIYSVVDSEHVAERFLDELSALNRKNEQQGLRAFWWEIGGTI